MSGGTACFQVARLAGGCCACADSCLASGKLVLSEARRLDHILQHTAHTSIHICLTELAALHSFHNLINEVGRAGLHQVIAGTDALGGVEETAPVGHDNTLEAPFVTEDVRQQVAARVGVFAVHLIIRTHHRPRLCLLHSNLERLEVNLAGSPL